MRILRRRSDSEVSAKGFALFVAGLLVATFLGGAARTLLSSARVHQRIVGELKKRFPKNQIEIGRIEVLLARGVWPGVGLEVYDLTVAQDRCGKLGFTLQIPRAILPLNLLSLRTGHARLGELDVPAGRVDLDFHACPRAGESDAPGAPSLRQTVQERGIRPPRLDWSDLADAVEGARLGDFEVNFRRTPQWKLKVASARVRFARELRLNAALEVQRSLPFGTLAHPVTIAATGRAGEIEWTVNSELKEGRLRWTGHWDLADNTARAEAVVTQVPLKELSSELHQIGLLAREFRFKSAWLTCRANWTGPLATPFASAVTLDGCRVEGGYGRAQLERADFFADRTPAFPKPAEIHVQRANLQGLAEAADAKLLNGVLARPGVWTGRVVVSSDSDWTALGRLEDVEVAFSNQSVHGKQIIGGVDVRARRDGDALALTLDNFGLVEGGCGGRVDVRYALAERTGAVDAHLSNLTLSPAVQSLLVGGRIGALTADGTADLGPGGLRRWDGRLRSGLLTGAGWRVDDLSADAHFTAGGVVHLNVRARRAGVDDQWRYFDQLQSIWPDAPAAVSWRMLNAKVGVRSEGGQIETLDAPLADGRGAWHVRGDWRREGELSATVQPAQAAGRTFRLRGERGRLKILTE